MRLHRFLWILAVAVCCTLATAQEMNLIPGIRATLRPKSYYVPTGQPVWMQFIIENETDEPITLTVPGTEPEVPSPEMGLPLAHLFSGGTTSGVRVTTGSGRRWEKPVGYRMPSRAPILIVGARSQVGTTVDLRDYYPTLRSAGQYRISWKPYNGGAYSESILITIAPRKQVEIITDDGKITIELLYDHAPNHVKNFLELAKSNFFTGQIFHRLEPGYILQGGCSRGDGTGIRLDGKRLKAEFNQWPHHKGTVSMALLDDDHDSASSQFFICYTRQKDWDGKYTAFGQLIGDDSYETLDRLMATPIDNDGRPIRDLRLRTVRIIDAPSSEIH